MNDRAAMNERAPVLDPDAFRAGLLMESAQAQQKRAEEQLEQLSLLTQGLDVVVRDEIRRTLVEELHALTAECDRAVRALGDIKRAATLRSLLWNAGVLLLCAGIPVGIAHVALPSAAEIADMKARRDALALNVAQLEQRGGHVEWRACGEARRLCVRIDRTARAYGAQADYVIVRGY